MKLLRSLIPAVWCLLAISTIQAQVIVANSSVKISDISKADIAAIFTGDSSNFSDGSRAVPVTLKGGPAHEAFLKEYIGENDFKFRGAWRGIVFAGKGTMPVACDSEADLIHHIATVPGSIGYVATAPNDPKVKTLHVK